ncbi:glycosyltransferase [Kocuria flava]|uniref:glycosyltransferase n=1 Tax=Kocuria flava TaxID=446860 RepID=UPI003F1AA547
MFFSFVRGLLDFDRAATPGSANEPELVIAHDYLTQRGGAERVVLSMHRAFPEAPIYTTFYDADGTFPEFREARIITSAFNRLGFLRRNVRLALPLLPFISSLLNVPGKLVLVSSTGWAHGFRTKGKKIVYCHSPARWLYLSRQYIGGPLWSSPKGWILAILRPFLIYWDQKAAATPVAYFSNSQVVAERIRNVYNRSAPVLHPPHSFDTSGTQVRIHNFPHQIESEGFFLLVSRLLPYKNVQVIVEVFRHFRGNLVIVGNGPLREEIQNNAPRNVILRSDLSDSEMRWLYHHCVAVIAPSYEDFGITPLEGAAYGKPTIALRAGGYLDTIVEGVTGTFVNSVSAVEFLKAINGFETQSWHSASIRRHAETFAETVFHEKLYSAINAARVLEGGSTDSNDGR